MNQANFGIRVPTPLNLASGSLAQDFKDWNDEVAVYLVASKAIAEPKATQTGIILNLAGSEVIKIAKHFTYDAGENKDDPNVLLKKIEEYCSPRSNEVFETFQFLKLDYIEPFDKFLMELRRRSESCNFGNASDRMIRDKIVLSMKPAVQKILLREKDLTLNRTIDICRTYVHAEKVTCEISSRSSEHVVQDISSRSGSKYKATFKEKKQSCRYCGKQHVPGSKHCPAYGKECYGCNGRNHFRSQCRRRVRRVERQYSDDSDSDDLYLNNYNVSHV